MLCEAPDLPVFDLPEPLAELYGGPLGFPPGCLYANFVSSIDGVVAGEGITPGMISLRSPADRFVMGLLRACADAVVIGAGTFRSERGHRWTPGQVYPEAADAFGQLRAALGCPPDPPLVVITASGALGNAFDALVAGSIVVTTARGAELLRASLPPHVEMAVVQGDGLVPVTEVMKLLADRGLRRVLTEGGPQLFGEMVAAGLVDQLFLTVSPVLAGGPAAGAQGQRGRFTTLTGGLPLLGPAGLLRAPLLGVRRHRSHLFLRYLLASSSLPAQPPGP